MAKVAITVNGSEAKNVYPPFILGSSAAASGDDVIIFFTPGGSPAMKKGAIKELNDKAEALPDLEDMFNSLLALGGRLMVCELAFDVHDFTEDDLAEGTEVVGATTFINESKDATLTFSF
ncbi:MAG TPA: DsrE/DsrF/DrsH-like family protein [Candidatus Krumholzibacteriaceae bacterium]|nr:DsrE/DsrF/DrsH-like family protein [Candidatus Krumholzibacteriaceae bacterium]